MDRLRAVLDARRQVADVRDDLAVRGNDPEALRHCLDAYAALSKLLHRLDPRFPESITDTLRRLDDDDEEGADSPAPRRGRVTVLPVRLNTHPDGPKEGNQ